MHHMFQKYLAAHFALFKRVDTTSCASPWVLNYNLVCVCVCARMYPPERICAQHMPTPLLYATQDRSQEFQSGSEDSAGSVDTDDDDFNDGEDDGSEDSGTEESFEDGESGEYGDDGEGDDDDDDNGDDDYF